MMVGRPQQPDPWGLAFDLLSPEEQSTIQRYPTKSSPTAKDYTVVEAILQAVQDKRKLCMQKRWTFTTISGRRIIIRDVLDKIAIWVNRFKEVGDTLVQYDPHHAAFPWAGIRFLLQASVNDLENFTIMAERLETVARLTARYSVFEAVYLSPDRGTPSPAQVKLLEALTGLYAECLRHLVDIGKYYDRPAKERIAQSIFGASSQKSSNNRLQSIATKEEEVEKLGQIIQAERAVHMSSAITTLDEKSQQSFQSLEALLQSLTAPVLRLSDPLTLLQDTLQEEERRKFLLWLSGYNYRQYHESSYKEIVRNTCQWIFFKTEYQEWQRSSVSSILWLHGIPGCGKTKLTSSVIQQHLDQAQKNKQNAPVAYVYCSSVSTSSKTMQMNATAILQTILKQLATSASTQTIRRPVWEEYKRRQEAAKMDGLDPSPLIADECVELLKTLMLDSPATIIIDGLDELEMQRFDLIMALKTLITESPNVVKIMISSREEVDIAQELRDSISICASAIENSADIDLFVKEKVNLAITNRRLLRGSVSEDLKNHLMRTLLDGANGMFLWPAMQLEYLSDHNKFKVEADIVTALENLPPTLFKTFDCLYKRIEECKYHSKGAATRALAWLLAAERTLSVSELMTAIRENVEDETLGTTKKTDHVYDAQKILDLCCNFVMLDTNTKKFSFVHASVRDYLLQLPEYSVSAINSLVAGRCLAYFMFDDDERVSESWSNEDETGDHGLPESSFREYAICHWAHHLLKVTDDEAKSKLDIVLKNFVSEEETMTFQQWLEDVKELVELKTPNRLKESHRTELNTILNDSSSPLFVACVYGLPSILEQMEAEISGSGRSIDYSATNLNGTPAVYISARYGRAAILQHLLEHGANVDEAGGFFGNPLQAAAFHGYLDVVKILMDWGANLSASGKFISALEAAMSGGNEKVIGALLKASNITQKDELEKVLLRVSYDGHNEIVANILGLLYPNEPGTLTRGTSANLHDTLQVALFQCRPRIVRRLLKDTIPDINMNTGHFGNALQAAAFGGHATMVVLVLEHGADINSRGRYGTALRAAALRGHDTIVKLLVDRGASIEGKDADAIAAAAFNGHFSTVQYLVSCGVYDVDQFSQMEPAVEAACFRGYIDVARLFLQTYHCKEHAKKCAQTVFSSALNGGRENIVRLALEYDPSIRDSDRPYVGLVPCGVNKGLSLLPDEHSSYRGDTKSPHQPPTQHEENNSAYTKFDTRLPWRSIDKQSAPISSEEQRHAMTANEDIGKGNGRFLRIAARNGFVGTLQHLLDQGNDINTTGDALHSNQPTPIEVASAAGQTQVVEFLLVKKAKVGKALSYAVSNQHPAVIEMLLQHLPDLALDDPVRLGEVGHRERSTSAIAVAVAWNFPDMLAILLKHGKKIQCSTIGSGLVVAVETGYINLLRSILCDFQLKDVGDEDSASNAREYRAFVAAVTMAARKRNISALQVLMDHVPLTTLKEQFLSRFITEGIAQEWYGSLQAIKTAFAPPFYDRLAGKALIAMAAVDRRRRGRKGADRDKTILFDEINRLSEISPISSCSAREALIEASKNFNLEIIHFLFGQHSEYHCRIQDPVVSWINLPNADGHTALYHACVTGCLKVFRDLVQAGASLYTTHAPYPMQFFSADGERVDNQRPTEVNLVQVAVDGCLASRWWRNSYTIWEEPLRDNWGPIVCALLNAGLKVDLKSVSLRTFFYISCFQGELLYVERLLKEGISLVGPSGKTEDRDLHFDSALHAAVVGGQRAVVDCLLSHGADVHYKAESKKRKNQTVVEACMKDRNFFKKKTESLQICAYLVHVGGDEADAEAVLVKACETDNVEIVKQMLHRGTRIENFPINASVDVFDAFVDAGYDFHSQLSFIAELQVRAIQEGNVALLSNLVEKYDLQHRFDMFSDCGWAIIRCEGDRAPVLRYLINKCSFDISTVYPSYAESSKMVNLLYQAACFAMNAEVVEFLLKEGADPDPPGFLFTPLTYCFKSHSSAIFPVVKTLLDFGADVNGSRKEDRELDGRLKPEFDRKPLVQAIHQGLLEVVELLIEKGADINHGQIPPLRLARVYERREIEDLLLRHGAVDNSDPTLSVTEYIMGIWTAMEK